MRHNVDEIKSRLLLLSANQDIFIKALETSTSESISR